MPGDRHQRFGRRAHPGRRGVAGRLRRHLFAQRDGVGRGAADFRDHGAVRRRRGVLARDDRLHRDGARHLLHVHHRPRRHQGDHARGGLDAGPRRRRHAFDALGRVPSRGGRRPERAAGDARTALLHAVEQRRRPAVRDSHGSDPDRRDEALDSIVPENPEQALRHARDHPRAWSTTVISWRCRRIARRTC